MVECSDGSLYTGITTDLDRRVAQHNAGTGARYTRTRRPVRLRASWEAADRSSALKEEYRIKQLSRSEKLNLISAQG